MGPASLGASYKRRKVPAHCEVPSPAGTPAGTERDLRGSVETTATGVQQAEWREIAQVVCATSLQTPA